MLLSHRTDVCDGINCGLLNVLQVRLGLCQLKVTDDKMKNIENASKAVQVSAVPMKGVFEKLFCYG